MKVLNSELQGVKIVEPDVFEDDRGYFVETFNAKRYHQSGIAAEFCQDNLSFSKEGVLRGLHFQKPNAQGKLVYVNSGEVFDVAVDIRLGSPNFGRWTGVYLSDENRRQLYIPPGFAHGFCVTSDTATFVYKCTNNYAPASEHSIIWDDPQIAIEWPLANPTLSAKDAKAPRLEHLNPDDLPVFSGSAE
jgi:dTDP-4-dehydrorhamnose 3,5-epimerase